MLPGYFRYSESERSEIWRNATIVLDANVLLNIYRYSPDTRDALLDSLSKLKHRLWIPHSIAEEFLRNRPIVICHQKKTYDDANKTAAKLLESLDAQRSHPFVNQHTLDKTKRALNQLVTELNQEAANHTGMLTDDPWLKRIEQLLEGRIGHPHSSDLLSKRSEVAKKRLDEKTPPGYQDASKDGNRPLGDTLFWLDVIDMAKAEKCDVILVTDDSKSDWWQEALGKKIGPRPELVNEFCASTGRKIVLYQPDLFLRDAFDHLNEKIAPEVMAEARHYSDKHRKALADAYRQKDRPTSEYIVAICRDIASYENQIYALMQIIEEYPIDYWATIDNPLSLNLHAIDQLRRIGATSPEVLDIMEFCSAIPRNRVLRLMPYLRRTLSPDHLHAFRTLNRLPDSVSAKISSIAKWLASPLSDTDATR